MLPLFAGFDGLAFHAQLMSAVILVSGLACLGVVLWGILRRMWLPRKEAAGAAPSPSFPHALDQLYTGLFMLFLLWGAWQTAQACAVPPTGRTAVNGSQLLLASLIQVGLYLPMLVRYGLLHRWQWPTRPWWHYLTLPLLTFGLIYLSIFWLEMMGFSDWLIRATGCPRYQDLVLLFTEGDTVRRLSIAISAVFLAPVAEECCFRGFLYPILRRWGGCVAAAITSALLFGAIHASLAQMLPLTLFGIAQCIAYEKARSLWLPIAVHMLFNTACLIGMLVLFS